MPDTSPIAVWSAGQPWPRGALSAILDVSSLTCGRSSAEVETARSFSSSEFLLKHPPGKADASVDFRSRAAARAFRNTRTTTSPMCSKSSIAVAPPLVLGAFLT